MNKKPLIIGIIIVVIIIVGIVVKSNWRRQKPAEEKIEEEILPQTELVPTVDASVAVDLTTRDAREVLLSVDQIPSGTTDIEYELSYLAKGGVPKGVIGMIPIADETQIERRITLGTCSSGRCVYDQGVEKVKVFLKFNGSFGSRLFEKEFEI